MLTELPFTSDGRYVQPVRTRLSRSNSEYQGTKKVHETPAIGATHARVNVSKYTNLIAAVIKCILENTCE